MKKPLLVLTALGLAACAVQESDYGAYLAKRGLAQPSLEGFQHCHGYGCQFKTSMSLKKADWNLIGKAFRPRPKTAAAERAAIAQAIGAFETRVGAIDGTATDKGGTFARMGNDQLDCVDESTNTTIYLALLKQKGLLRFHDLQAPMVRTPFETGRWPHQTAVITDKKTGEAFVVDSWFHDNGAPAEIVPLAQWKDGWKPG